MHYSYIFLVLSQSKNNVPLFSYTISLYSSWWVFKISHYIYFQWFERLFVREKKRRHLRKYIISLSTIKINISHLIFGLELSLNQFFSSYSNFYLYIFFSTWRNLKHKVFLFDVAPLLKKNRRILYKNYFLQCVKCLWFYCHLPYRIMFRHGELSCFAEDMCSKLYSLLFFLTNTTLCCCFLEPFLFWQYVYMLRHIKKKRPRTFTDSTHVAL